MVRCDNCGFENPQGALVCRRCKRRLRGRADTAGPRRESEAELTRVVVGGLTRLAAVIAGILVLGNLLAYALYRRPEPGMLLLAALAILAAIGGRWQSGTLNRTGASR